MDQSTKKLNDEIQRLLSLTRRHQSARLYAIQAVEETIATIEERFFGKTGAATPRNAAAAGKGGRRQAEPEAPPAASSKATHVARPEDAAEDQAHDSEVSDLLQAELKQIVPEPPPPEPAAPPPAPSHDFRFGASSSSLSSLGSSSGSTGSNHARGRGLANLRGGSSEDLSGHINQNMTSPNSPFASSGPAGDYRGHQQQQRRTSVDRSSKLPLGGTTGGPFGGSLPFDDIARSRDVVEGPSGSSRSLSQTGNAQLNRRDSSSSAAAAAASSSAASTSHARFRYSQATPEEQEAMTRKFQQQQELRASLQAQIEEKRRASKQ